MKKFVRFLKDESGVTAIEYGLIAAAIAVMLTVVAPDIADALSATFQVIIAAL